LYNGWAVNAAQDYNINFEAKSPKSMTSWLAPHHWGYRAWDFYMLYLGDRHVIQIGIIHFYPACGAVTRIFTKKTGSGGSENGFLRSQNYQESPFCFKVKCPNLDLHSTELGE